MIGTIGVLPRGNRTKFDVTAIFRVRILSFFHLTRRRFKGHSAFVVSSFDISRLNHTSKTNVLARRKNWLVMEPLLLSLIAEQFTPTASEAEKHQPTTDPKGVVRVGSTAAGSEERNSYMPVQ
jgi:hypothetical protein